MATNLSIESPNFEKINKEAGQFTEDAINLLWAVLNDTRKSLRIDFRRASEIIAPKVKSLAPAASLDNLDSEGASILSFNGANNVNLTGIRAPETGEARVMIIQVNGTGTITMKHEVTSEAANRLTNAGAVDVARASGQGIIYAYLSPRWREVARSG